MPYDLLSKICFTIRIWWLSHGDGVEEVDGVWVVEEFLLEDMGDTGGCWGVKAKVAEGPAQGDWLLRGI